MSANFRRQDHPRLCGEKKRKCRSMSTWLGSPPPMRGKVKSIIVCVTSERITPAYAGKSLPSAGNSPVTLGSPPPMRGKGLNAPWSGFHFRITPAYAGKRAQQPFRPYDERDHPRLCGEKLKVCNNAQISRGSPPPMRGKGSGNSIPHQGKGITPAYAGKSLKLLSCFFVNQDHPRLCGEKLVMTSFNALFRGSPPPMRGKAAFFSATRVS